MAHLEQVQSRLSGESLVYMPSEPKQTRSPFTIKDRESGASRRPWNSFVTCLKNCSLCVKLNKHTGLIKIYYKTQNCENVDDL